MSFAEEVYKTVRAIPEGKVATYGQIAEMVGRPQAARAVGGALHKNPYEGEVPCHRVVNAQGRLAPNFAFDGPTEQKVRLEMEGVKVSENETGEFVVDLAEFGW